MMSFCNDTISHFIKNEQLFKLSLNREKPGLWSGMESDNENLD